MSASNPSVNAVSVAVGAVAKQPRIYEFSLTLVTNTPQSFDLRPLQYLNRIKEVQGIFVDNSAGTSPCSISAGGAAPLIVPGGYQGMLPLYLSDNAVLLISGAGLVNFVLTNFSVPAAVWIANGASADVIGGLLQVQDAAIEALIANGALNVSNVGYGTADALVHKRFGSPFAGSLTAAATAAIITGAPSVFLTNIDVTLSPDATLASAGILTITGALAISAVNVFVRKIWVPATAADGNPTTICHIDNLNIVGALSGDNFDLTLSVALLTGSVEYTIVGGTTGVL